MVDFQSRDTRRGPTTDDTEAEAVENEHVEDGADDERAEGEQTDSERNTDSERTDSERAEGEQTDDGLPAHEQADDERDHDTPGTASAEAEDASEATAAETPEPVDRDDAEATPDGPPVSAKAVPETRPAPSRSIDVAVVTVGTEAFEPLEDAVTTGFESGGHDVVARDRLRGGYDAIQQMVESLVGREDVDVVVTVGGVGLATDELAIEAVHPLLEKALPGFGEAFRSLLFEQVGTGIVAVRSAAGVANGTLVFCLPADPEAAGLAVEEILAVEAPELVAQLE